MTKRTTMNNYSQVGFQTKDSLKVVVFMTSSTGDGEFPENGIKFQSYLRKESSNRALSHIFYTVLGLGDSNYSKYQGAPRFLDQRLQELGASKFYARAEADDATNLAIVVEPWLAGLPTALKHEIARLQSLSQTELKQIIQDQTFQSAGQDELIQAVVEDQSTTKYTAKLVERVIICDDGDKQVYKVKLELCRSVTRERLDVGQSISVFPLNKKADVLKIVSSFGWNKDQLIGNYTIEQMLLSQIDIHRRKLNLEHLAKHFQIFTSYFEADLEKLMGEDRIKYSLYELVTHSAPFVLERFMLSENSLEDGLLKMQPRYYSILHDPFIQTQGVVAAECRELTLCFTLHKFKNDFGIEQDGLCTSYLAQAPINSEVNCQISKNTRVLQLPASPLSGAPLKLLIICMGTGVVPFIGMLERIQATGQPVSIQMFFGVRNNNTSFYFGEFLTQFFASRDSSNHLYVACSRDLEQSKDQESKNVTLERGRLQESLFRFNLKTFQRLETADGVEGVPDTETHILICGNRNALQKSVFESLLMSEETKQNLKESGRLLMELWNE